MESITRDGTPKIIYCEINIHIATVLYLFNMLEAVLPLPTRSAHSFLRRSKHPCLAILIGLLPLFKNTVFIKMWNFMITGVQVRVSSLVFAQGY